MRSLPATLADVAEVGAGVRSASQGATESAAGKAAAGGCACCCLPAPGGVTGLAGATHCLALQAEVAQCEWSLHEWGKGKGERG